MVARPEGQPAMAMVLLFGMVSMMCVRVCGGWWGSEVDRTWIRTDNEIISNLKIMSSVSSFRPMLATSETRN